MRGHDAILSMAMKSSRPWPGALSGLQVICSSRRAYWIEIRVLPMPSVRTSANQSCGIRRMQPDAAARGRTAKSRDMRRAVNGEIAA